MIILQGNCIDKIKELDDNSIDCVVSSPPYFGLRDYGTAQWQGGNPNCEHKKSRFNYSISDKQKSNNGSSGLGAYKNGEFCKCGAKRIDEQFGLEPTYQKYIANTVKVFETFKPKLKDTATIWWNVGDSYSSGLRKTPVQNGIKEKDLLMIPNRVAIALQDAGWYIRSEIIWHKPNPMPESVRDRPTSAHEKIWLITKSKKYYYDADAIKEDAAWDRWGKQTHIKEKVGKAKLSKDRTKEEIQKLGNGKRNKRNVWTITTKPFKDAHFATFPKDLIEPCIKAGCPEGGIVLDPFGGAGTTGIVAKSLNRKAILIELNPDYIEIAKNRINKEFGMFNENNNTLYSKKAARLYS